VAATSRDAQHTPALLREPPEVPAGHDQRQAAPALLRAQRNPTVRGEFQPAEKGPASAVPEPGAACRFLLPGQILANLKRLGALATCTRSGPEGTRLSWAVLIPNWGWLFGSGEDLFNAWKRSVQMISLLRPSLDSFHKEKKLPFPWLEWESSGPGSSPSACRCTRKQPALSLGSNGSCARSLLSHRCLIRGPPFGSWYPLQLGPRRIVRASCER
jgi:hypothetical protein